MIDMYADNILSVIDSFPLLDKHVFLAEMLTLLLFEYKRSAEKQMNFTVELNTSYLKFLDELKFLKCLGKNARNGQEFESINSDDLHESIHVDKTKFAFTYLYNYASKLSSNELMEVINDYLDVLLGE